MTCRGKTNSKSLLRLPPPHLVQSPSFSNNARTEYRSSSAKEGGQLAAEYVGKVLASASQANLPQQEGESCATQRNSGANY